MAESSQEDFLDIKTTTQKFQKVLKERGLEGLRKEVNKVVDLWQKTKLNVGVTGSSGSGKSSFINAMLGLDESSEAPTGVTETTKEVKCYTKSGSHVAFWDLPGVGTPMFPRETYIEKVKLNNFDFVILVARGRFTENDAWLAEQIHTLGKRYYFIRTHVGQDIRNYRKAHPTCPDPEKQLHIIRDDCETNLENVSQKQEGQKKKTIHVYLIDNFMCESYDFNLLAAALIREAGGIKSSILAAGLSSATQEIIDEKRRGLLRRIQFVSVQAGMNCTKDSAEHVMKDVFVQESKLYREVFEIDDDTLRQDHDLFSLSELGTKMITKQLKVINKRLITTRVKELKKGIELLEEKSKSETSRLEIGQQNYVAIIFDLLLRYMECMHLLASSLFQNVSPQLVEMCAAENK